MNTAELRHALRTPINHIIGFAEIIHEETPDLDLSALISTAREIVSLIQSSQFDTPEEVDTFRRALVPYLRSLEAQTPGPEHVSSDLDNVRKATARLVAFAENQPGSLDAVAGPFVAPDRTALPIPDAVHGKARLLIVDDNSSNLEILQRHLEAQGFQVTPAHDGQECLNLISSHKFDLVLLDVQMPRLDGFEVLRRLRDDPATRDIPVVMISALEETAGVIRCIQMGAEDYLTKPFDPVLLGARIGASLEKKRLRDEERRRTDELQAAIEELRRTQAQLVVQDKLASLGALTAGIAHEIRNPLNFVINFSSASADLVRDFRANPSLPTVLDQLEKYVSKINEHGKRAERIVRSMLLHSRGKTGTREPVDVNAMLNDCLNLAFHGLRAQDSNFNVRFTTNLGEDIPQISAVPQELSRAFLNILNNAFYAAYQARHDREPEVIVETTKAGSNVEIRIRDTGEGIAQEILPKIFNPFFTTKPAGAGTGLGLSLSYEIVVQLHKGTLRAQGEPGHGAEFIISLPVANDHTPTPDLRPADARIPGI